jgi:hypothetical protein
MGMSSDQNLSLSIGIRGRKATCAVELQKCTGQYHVLEIAKQESHDIIVAFRSYVLTLLIIHATIHMAIDNNQCD